MPKGVAGAAVGLSCGGSAQSRASHSYDRLVIAATGLRSFHVHESGSARSVKPRDIDLVGVGTQTARAPSSAPPGTTPAVIQVPTYGFNIAGTEGYAVLEQEIAKLEAAA
jgi:hypothetical protein